MGLGFWGVVVPIYSAIVLYSRRALKLTLSRCFTYRVPQQPWKGAAPPPHPQPHLSCKQETWALWWVQIPGRKARAGMWALYDPVYVPGITRKGNACERGWENEVLREWPIDNACKIKLDISFQKLISGYPHWIFLAESSSIQRKACFVNESDNTLHSSRFGIVLSWVSLNASTKEQCVRFVQHLETDGCAFFMLNIQRGNVNLNSIKTKAVPITVRLQLY